MPRQKQEPKERAPKPQWPQGPEDLLDILKRRNRDIYVEFEVACDVISKIVGGTPRLLEAIFALIDTRVKQGKLSPEEGERIKLEVRKQHEEKDKANRLLYEAEMVARENTGEDVDPENLPTSARAIEASWNTFWQDPMGLYLETRTIKSTLRDVFSALQKFTPANRKKVGHNFGLYIEAPPESPHRDRVYLYRGGSVIQRPDTFEDRPVLIKGEHPRTALKRNDVIYGKEEGEGYGCQFGFKVKVLRDGPLTHEDIVDGLALLMDRGLGAAVSQGNGKWEPLHFQRLG